MRVTKKMPSTVFSRHFLGLAGRLQWGELQGVSKKRLQLENIP